MSQPSPIKTEPKSDSAVKAEPSSDSTIPAAAAAAAAAGDSSASSPANASSAKSEQGWQEIPLKCCTEEDIKDIRYHILKFQTKQDVDIIKNFTKPVRLHRKDPRNIQFQLTRQEIEQRKKEQEEAKREKERIKKEYEERKAREDEELEAAEAERAAANGEKRDDIKNNISANGIGLVNPDPPKNKDNGADLSQVAPDGGARKPRKNLFKRKTRQINLMDDNKRKLRYEEYYPWVLEDYDGKNVFVGNYEAGSSDTQHVLFVFDKDGFKMVPAEKVYKFTPRNKYATLTLEEAEAKMEKNSSVPRWLMRHMEDQSSAVGGTADQRFRHSQGPGSSSSAPIATGGPSGNFGGSIGGIGAVGRGGSGRRLRTVIGGASSNDRDSDHDDLDYDEEFADDEEAPIMDGDEEENKLSEKKLKKEMYKAAHFGGQSDAEDDDDLDDLFETEKSRKVDKEGEKLRKVLNKTEGGVYDTDDDDKLNPYLSKSDLESDDDSDSDEATKDQIQVKTEQDDSIPGSSQQQRQQQSRSIFASNKGDGFFSIRAPPAFLRNFQPGVWNPNARKIPSPGVSGTVTNRPETSSIAKPVNSPTASPSPEPPISNSSSAVDLSSSGPDGVLVTTKEVLDIVRVNPPTTKDLLVRLKHRVNAHKDNKQRIIAIVKQNLKLVDGKLVLKEDG